MAPKTVSLSPAKARQLQEDHRFLRGLRRNTDGARRGQPSPPVIVHGVNVQTLRVTSATATDGRYPAVVLRYDSEDGSWHDIATGPAAQVWLGFASGYLPTAADVSMPTRFEARQYGPAADGRPVFVNDFLDPVQILRALQTTPGPAWIPDGMGGYAHPAGSRYGYPAVLQDVSGGTYQDRGVSLAISSGLAQGATTITVADTTGIRVGTLLLVVATVPVTLYPGGQLAEFVVVTAVTPTTFTAAFANDYSAGVTSATAYTAGAWLSFPNGGAPLCGTLGGAAHPDNTTAAGDTSWSGDAGTYPVQERPGGSPYYLARFAGVTGDDAPVYSASDPPFGGASGGFNGTTAAGASPVELDVACVTGNYDLGPGAFAAAHIDRDGWMHGGPFATTFGAPADGIYQCGCEAHWGSQANVSGYAIEIHLFDAITSATYNDRVAARISVPYGPNPTTSAFAMTPPIPMKKGDSFSIQLFTYGTGGALVGNAYGSAWVNKLA